MKKQEALIYLVEKQELALLKDFMNNFKDFQYNFTTDKGDNLLHYAAKKQSSNTLGIIQSLLEKGVDPLGVNEKFLTPLEVAKQSNNIPAMTLMKHYINKKLQEEQTYF